MDLLLRRSDHWLAIEVKSASTIASDFSAGLRRFEEQTGGALDGLPIRPVVVYGGEEAHRGSLVEIVPWQALPELLDAPD